MLINLLPDFLSILNSSDRTAAYLRYFESHRAILEAYWENYVVSSDSPHFSDIARAAATADRSDLKSMLELESDVDVDVVVMVGVGGANAGELVVNGRGVAFVCLEHFTSVQNQETQGLGLDPELIPMWLAHEIAHAVRYTSPTSRSELRQSIQDSEGYYSYWETGKQVRLKELLMNEGLATLVSREVSPGHAAWQYYGYGRRQFARVRELESVITTAVGADIEQTGLGLRLKYLSSGMSDDARTVDKYVIPERAGYYVGTRMAENAARANGLAWAIRAGADELVEVRGRGVVSA
jgi:hypothetical protein